MLREDQDSICKWANEAFKDTADVKSRCCELCRSCTGLMELYDTGDDEGIREWLAEVWIGIAQVAGSLGIGLDIDDRPQTPNRTSERHTIAAIMGLCKEVWANLDDDNPVLHVDSLLETASITVLDLLRKHKVVPAVCISEVMEEKREWMTGFNDGTAQDVEDEYDGEV